MKAVFFDIDGTLFIQNKGVPKSTIEAIRKIQENGHKAFICTGRSRAMIPQNPILDIGFDGVVGACGAYGELDNQVVFDNHLSDMQLQKMYEIFRRYDTMYILEGTEYIYYDEVTFEDNPDDWYVQLVKSMLKERFISVQYAMKHFGKVEANKVSLAEKNGISNEPLYDLFRPDYEVLVHDFKVAEIVPKGCHKAKGMERMCNQIGVDICDSIAVGDSINDVDMLRAAGIGICMGNGTEIAKKNADYITKDLYDDGIYHALRHFGLF